MKNKKNIIKNFLNQGYSVVDCENLNKLELIKEKIYKLSISLLQIKNLKPELFFDNLNPNHIFLYIPIHNMDHYLCPNN